MPSWKPFSYFFIISDSGTLAQATLLAGVGSQIAAETRASSGASVGRQGERVRGIVLVYIYFRVGMRGMVVVVKEVGSWRWSLRWKMEMDRDQ